METAIATAVLQAAGMPEDKIKELDAITADKVAEFKPDGYLEQISTAQRTQMLNDPKFYETHITEEKLPTEFRKKVESAQYGRFINEFKDVATKTLGLKEGEDFTADDATKLKVFAEKVAKGYLGKNAPKGDIKVIQDQLIAAVKEKEDLENGFTEKLNTAVSDANTKAMTKLDRLASVQKIGEIKDLNVKPHIVADHLMGTLRSQYTVKLDPETLQFSLKQKANPELDVVEGSKVLTFDDALTKLAKAEGLLKEGDGSEKKDEKSGTVEVEVDGEKAGVVPDYIKNKMEKDAKK